MPRSIIWTGTRESDVIDQAHIDLPALVGGRVHLHRDGRTLRGRCPLHAGKSDTSLSLFETPHGWRWRCWAGCNDGRSGDAIAWLMSVHGLDFKAACAALGAELPARSVARTLPVPPDDAQPPPAAWQAAAQSVADDATGRLWRPEGAKALAWLHKRGFKDATIHAAGLGYLPADAFVPREHFGLPVEVGGPRRLALPRGITIPWALGGVPWKLWVRTSEHRAPWRDDAGNDVFWPKYQQIPGGSNAPWGLDTVQRGKPVLLAEGVFDALAVQQEGGDLITPIVTGTTGARRVRWIARLALAPLALLSFDADRGGDAPTRYWASVLPRTRIWRPYYDDPAAMLTRPGAVRAWVQAGVAD